MRRVIISIDYETEVKYDVNVNVMSHAPWDLAVIESSWESAHFGLHGLVRDIENDEVESYLKYRDAVDGDAVKKLMLNYNSLIDNYECDYEVNHVCDDIFEINCEVIFTMEDGVSDLNLNRDKLRSRAKSWLDEWFSDFLSSWSADSLEIRIITLGCDYDVNHECQTVNVGYRIIE